MDTRIRIRRKHRSPSRVTKLARKPRRTFVIVHRWLGLIVAGWVVFQGLSGSIQVLTDQINGWSHPGLWHHGSGDLGPAAAIRAAAARLPGARAASVSFPHVQHGVYVVSAVAHGKLRAIYIDPASAGVNGVRNPSEGFTFWVQRWHSSLLQTHPLLGIKPSQIVGWLGVLTVVVLLLGLYIWYWPGVKRWARLRSIRRGRGRYTFNMDLHKTVGVVTAPILLVVLMTGLNIEFAKEARPLWYGAVPGRDGGPKAPASPPHSSPSTAGPQSADQILESVHLLGPRGAVDSIAFPTKASGAVAVTMSVGRDPAVGPAGQGGNKIVYLDAFTGRVLRVVGASDHSVSGQAYEYWAFPTHGGVAGGTPTRVIWLVVGLAPMAMLVTGLSGFLIRTGKGRRRAGRRALPRLDREQVRLIGGHAVVRDVGRAAVIVREGDRPDIGKQRFEDASVAGRRQVPDLASVGHEDRSQVVIEQDEPAGG